MKQATPINFISTLSKKNLLGMFFIGYGLMKEHAGKREPSILLENEDGSGQFVTAQKLKMIMDVANCKLDLCFI